MPTLPNTLYYGDNLDVLKRYIKDETVDLIYLDPPFNSNQDYNVLFAEKSGIRSAAQIRAFEDTWRWDQGAALIYQQTVEAGGKVAQVMQAFRRFLGENDMLAYLSMMAPRLVELRQVLKSTGSIYLHCDPTASHYLKMLMDAVFGPQNFRNEIIWERTTGRKSGKQYGRVHDALLFFTKTSESTWNPPSVPQTEETAKGHDLKADREGRIYRLSDLSGAGQGPTRKFGDKVIPPPSGRHWMFDQDGIDDLMKEERIEFTRSGQPRLRTYIDDLPGVAIRDIWTDIKPINAAAAERLGYPTQKPEALLERIIKASSNEGDLVLDPFCGCGTTIASAQQLKRRWVGIDITPLAITLIKHRLQAKFGSRISYRVIGEPVDVSGAKALAEQDPFHFQVWALGLVGARPTDLKKGADQGIDGRIYFFDEHLDSGKTKQIIFSVKAGHTGPTHLRDLWGVVDREKAQIGVLISLQEPTKAMRSEAAKAGFYVRPTGGKEEERYPRLQLLTVEELLAGKKVAYPTTRVDLTFKKAPKAEEEPRVAPARLPFDE